MSKEPDDDCFASFETCFAGRGLIMFRIKSKYGWLRHFDGTDYFWTPNEANAWKMVGMDVTLHFNRLASVPGVEIVSESEG